MTAAWKGWSTRRGSDDHGWVELSRVLHPDIPRMSSFPQPRVERIRRMPADPLNLTEIQMVVHVGTHVDAPCHFVPDGPSIDEVPIDRLFGDGVVWPLDELEPYEPIGVERLEAAEPRVQPDDILLLSTGWAAHFGTARYHAHPSLAPAAARWLVERGIKLVGLDLPTPDLATERRGEGFDWPVHQILLSNGVLIGEHLADLDALAGQRVEVWFLPLRIAGADGGPARVLARPKR